MGIDTEGTVIGCFSTFLSSGFKSLGRLFFSF